MYVGKLVVFVAVVGSSFCFASVPLPSRRPLSSTQAFALEQLKVSLGLEDGEELEAIRGRFEEFAASESPYPVSLNAYALDSSARTSDAEIAKLADAFASAAERIAAGLPHGHSQAFRHLVRANFVAGSTLGVRQQLFSQAMAQNVGLSTVALMALVSRILIDRGLSNLAWDGALVGSLAGLAAVLAVNHQRQLKENPEGPVFLAPAVRSLGTRDMARLSLRQFWHRVRDLMVANPKTPDQLKSELVGVTEPDVLAGAILTHLGVRGHGCSVWLED